MISLGIIPLDAGNGLQLCYERHQPKPPTMSRRWTPEDIEALCSLAGDLPWPMVPAAFNCTRPPRTATAIRIKAEGLGISRRSVGQFITTGAIKELTGYSYERIRRWINSGDLVTKRWAGCGSPNFIARKDLQDFAKKHPEHFGGLSESILVQLLDSEKLAASIFAKELPKWKKCVEVECVETGQRFNSIKAAAKSAYVNKERMRIVLITGGAANGRHYRRVELAGATRNNHQVFRTKE